MEPWDQGMILDRRNASEPGFAAWLESWKPRGDVVVLVDQKSGDAVAVVDQKGGDAVAVERVAENPPTG